MLIKQGKIVRPEGEERERVMRLARGLFFQEQKDKGLTMGECERMIIQDCKRIVIAEYFNL